MRAERDDVRLAPERRNYTMHIVIGAVLILALLLYIGLRDSDELLEETPGAVVRDSAIVAPPVVDTDTAPAQPQAAQNDAGSDATRDFSERQLPPPTDTVGVGVVAPTAEREISESLVIDGDLLKELEEDAQVRAGEASPEQLRTPQ